jgi:shikimate kinase
MGCETGICLKSNIVLVGFMGVGKGRTARDISARSSKYALDCDDLIESYANKKIRKIFKDEGEARFRELERQTAVWLEKNVTDSVISTGGGFINVPNLNQIGTVVYLHSDFDTILSAIRADPNAEKKIKKRPLLQNLKAARKLYEQRLPLYRKCADVEVYMADRSIARVAEEILDRVSALQKA